MREGREKGREAYITYLAGFGYAFFLFVFCIAVSRRGSGKEDIGG